MCTGYRRPVSRAQAARVHPTTLRDAVGAPIERPTILEYLSRFGSRWSVAAPGEYAKELFQHAQRSGVQTFSLRSFTRHLQMWRSLTGRYVDAI